MVQINRPDSLSTPFLKSPNNVKNITNEKSIVILSFIRIDLVIFSKKISELFPILDF